MRVEPRLTGAIVLEHGLWRHVGMKGGRAYACRGFQQWDFSEKDFNFASSLHCWLSFSQVLDPTAIPESRFTTDSHPHPPRLTSLAG